MINLGGKLIKIQRRRVEKKGKLKRMLLTFLFIGFLLIPTEAAFQKFTYLFYLLLCQKKFQPCVFGP